jgi:hypothetical protein|tara:strand:- start:1155 stop:1571 length:417 start_codon:yes stop_codon:yes gene_type:complete
MSTTTTFSNDVQRKFETQEVITESKAITAADSGKTFLISGTGYTITLPETTAGVVYKFKVAAAFSTDMLIQTVSTQRDTISGSLIVAGAVVDADAVDRVTFEDGAERIGDFIELSSDGSVWTLFGNGAQSSSITVGEL